MLPVPDFLRGWFRKPHPVILRNRELFAAFDQSRPLSEYRFVVFDTELTGLNRRRDEIISIGAVSINNLMIELGSSFHMYIRPTRQTEYTDSTFIHRITPQQLDDAPLAEEVLPMFVEFCGDALLTGHFVGIDMHFLNKACRDVLGGYMSNPSVDTMRLARGYKEGRGVYGYGQCDQSESYHLADLTEEFNLPPFRAHDALEDAMQTAYLFLFLIKKMKKGGIGTLKQLYQAGRIWHLM
jgi:DNA polymerase-3 subunit epsilon